MQLLHQYTNGNADIKLYNDGTRIIECEGDLKLKYPLNIDIRVSKKCAFGMNPRTGKAVCNFCHESATTDGEDADLEELYNKLIPLPAGIELAIGMNQITSEFVNFLARCKWQGWVVNATINQGHLRRDKDDIICLLNLGLIKGLGVSYRSGMLDIPDEILSYENMVVHVIAGIDSVEEVSLLAKKGVRKILVLGEKDFGFNLGKVRLTTEKHRQWYRRVHELFNLFKVVSFDNLALEQLNIRRFVKDWDTIYQNEYSFYINAVDKYFAPSSRSANVESYENGLTVKDYFIKLFPEFNKESV